VAGQTVTRWLRRNATESPDQVAVRRMAPDGSGLEEWTWADLGDRSARLAAAFGRVGLSRGDRALLFLRNRPEFHTVDLGVLLAGGTPLSVYNSSAPEQIA
jgi:long-chain acyl-CoA synthetase